MTKQQRALRTRTALVRAAAVEFDRDGYAGASLAQIRDAAQISMGAVTFHFATKAELADAIEGASRTMAADVAARVMTDGPPSLHLAARFTLELTGLLEREVVVRAGARLARERPGSPEWSSAWVPALRRMLERLHVEGSLPPSAAPDLLVALVMCLLEGMDAALRRSRRTPNPAEPGSFVGELARFWQIIFAGVNHHDCHCLCQRPERDPRS
ncbi:TetR family transcriptional regulator [Streptomyces albidoflavus]